MAIAIAEWTACLGGCQLSFFHRCRHLKFRNLTVFCKPSLSQRHNLHPSFWRSLSVCLTVSLGVFVFVSYVEARTSFCIYGEVISPRLCNSCGLGLAYDGKPYVHGCVDADRRPSRRQVGLLHLWRHVHTPTLWHPAGEDSAIRSSRFGLIRHKFLRLNCGLECPPILGGGSSCRVFLAGMVHYVFCQVFMRFGVCEIVRS